LPPDADRVLSELRQTRVVDDQDGIWAAQQVLGVLGDEMLKELRRPGTVSDEVLEVIVVSGRNQFRHWLHALSMR